MQLALAAILGLTVVSSAEGKKNELPADARAILEKAESFELYSLDPDPAGKKRKAKGELHGWWVLGKTIVKEADARQKIRAALLKGVADSTGRRHECFEPRHGLKASRGSKTVDLVICFECLQIESANP